MKIDLPKDLYTQIMTELEFAMKTRFDDCEEGDLTVLMSQLEEVWEEGVEDPVEEKFLHLLDNEIALGKAKPISDEVWDRAAKLKKKAAYAKERFFNKEV